MHLAHCYKYMGHMTVDMVLELRYVKTGLVESTKLLTPIGQLWVKSFCFRKIYVCQRSRILHDSVAC